MISVRTALAVPTRAAGGRPSPHKGLTPLTITGEELLRRGALPAFTLPGVAGPVITRILPAVRSELRHWSALAGGCPDPLLRREAVSSLETKRFHCQGGGTLALLAGTGWRDAVRFIVGLQTISDYLDNLCDRTGCNDRRALRRLHMAMTHAVDPPPGLAAGHTLPDYYSLFPAGNDGGYLASLVRTCAIHVETQRVPARVRAAGRRLVSLYSSLQVHKHGPDADRVERLRRWHRRSLSFLRGTEMRGGVGFIPGLRSDEDLTWPEFAAACGSTLAVFAMYSSAGSESPEALFRAYYPWICALHILLDYLIDREEDSRAGDLNLTAFYRDDRQRDERLASCVRRALAAAETLDRPRFHRTLVAGLLSVYLSDPKVQAQGLDALARALLDVAGRDAWSLFALCLGLRRSGLA
jgi:tetraprenyl-beta-curcumene synthase